MQQTTVLATSPSTGMLDDGSRLFGKLSEPEPFSLATPS